MSAVVVKSAAAAVAAGAAAAAAALFVFRRHKKKTQKSTGSRSAAAAAADEPRGASVLEVYATRPLDDDPDVSPPCLKLLAFLKLAGVPYAYVPYKTHLMRGAPKRKVPFVRGGPHLEKPLGDSQFIVEAFQARGIGSDLDAWLTDEQRAIATAFRVMLEESVYWSLLAVRWIDETQFERHTVPLLFGNINPPVLRRFVARGVRAKCVKVLDDQGYGRHAPDELVHLMRTQLGALETYLGGSSPPSPPAASAASSSSSSASSSDKPFFFGDRPCTLDCVVYAFTTSLVQGPWVDHPVAAAARSFDKLMAHQARLKALLAFDVPPP